MADRSFILYPAAQHWSITAHPPLPGPPLKIAFAPTAPPAEIAAAISAALKTAGYTGKPVALCVPSAWCLCGSISIADLPRRDSKAMLFRLEENLPLAAESVVADFVIHNDSALGVCARLDAVAPLTAALESAGITVQSIMPAALATAQGFASLVSDCVLLCNEPDAADPAMINVIVLQDGLPINWAFVAATAVDLKLQLDLLSTQLGTVPPIQAVDIPAELISLRSDTAASYIDVGHITGHSSSGAVAADLLRGRLKPWVEFRRNQLAIADPIRLHRRWINASLAAAIALLLSLTLVFLLRAHRYRQLEQASRDEMVDSFHQHFPGWETPLNLRAVVDAQYRRVNGGTSPAIAARASALVTLHDILLPVMQQDHVQISRMAFHENAFEITGRLASYEQLDALSKLAGESGMIVAPPQSRKDTDGTWTFQLQGSKPPQTASKQTQ